MQTFHQSPVDRLDYELPWAEELNGDTIVASTWELEDGIVQEERSFTASSTLVWISGGVLDKYYLVKNKITTAQGRIQQRSFKLGIRERSVR